MGIKWEGRRRSIVPDFSHAVDEEVDPLPRFD